MKQILPKLKEVNKYLSFLKNCFTKPQFNHVKNYVEGLIALNKKTIKSISRKRKEFQTLIIDDKTYNFNSQ